MMHLNRVWPVIWAVLLLSVTSAAFAQGNSTNAPGHLFGDDKKPRDVGGVVFDILELNVQFIEVGRQAGTDGGGALFAGGLFGGLGCRGHGHPLRLSQLYA